MVDEQRKPPDTSAPSLAWRETGPKPNDLVAAPHNGFRIDRSALAESVDAVDEEDTDAGIHRFSDIPAEAVAAAIRHALACKALTGPEDVVVNVLKLAQRPDTVILGLYEGYDRATHHLEKRQEAGLCAERQVTSWAIEPRELCDSQDRTFGGLCITLEYVCERLNGLLGSLQALLDGEQMQLDRVEAPLIVLTYNSRARIASFRGNVQDVCEADPDQAKVTWPLLMEVLERGEADEDWDGDRQRAFRLVHGCEAHLAHQLVQLRTMLEDDGKVTPGALPDPSGGFASYRR
jgi:hypothetical protein